MSLAALGSQTNDPSLLEKYQPGPLALLIVVLLGLVLVLLFRSMSRQLKRVDFDDTATTDDGRAAGRRRDAPPVPGDPREPGSNPTG